MCTKLFSFLLQTISWYYKNKFLLSLIDRSASADESLKCKIVPINGLFIYFTKVRCITRMYLLMECWHTHNTNLKYINEVKYEVSIEKQFQGSIATVRKEKCYIWMFDWYTGWFSGGEIIIWNNFAIKIS